jgi:two-component system, chemotaxis family, response regulator Rcp1
MKSIEILLVEDNAGDILLTIDALKEGRVSNHVNIVKDGEEAMDYLKKRGQYSNSISPDIILLDLNIPKKSGLQVLNEIKNDIDLKKIPVVVLTSSAADVDIINAYDNHVNCYIRKPVELENFMEVIRKIEDFWLSIVKLPGQG